MTDTKPVCLDCERKNQKEAPTDSLANDGCSLEYSQVSKCMKENKDQISACVKEWSVFKTCHYLKSRPRN
jgi:CHCH domain